MGSKCKYILPVWALCYSVAEYCAQVWAPSTYMHLVDAQLNNSMQLISSTLRPMPLPWLPVLSYIEPPALRCKPAVNRLVAKATVQHARPLNNDLIHPPQHRLTLRTPLWFDMEPVDIISQWHDDWSSASVVNCDLVQNHTIHPPGFGLPRKQWCILKGCL